MIECTFGNIVVMGDRLLVARLRSEFAWIKLYYDNTLPTLKVRASQLRGVILIIPVQDYAIADVQGDDAEAHGMRLSYGFTRSPCGRSDISPAARFKNQNGDDIYVNFRYVDHIPELNRLHK